MVVVVVVIVVGGVVVLKFFSRPLLAIAEHIRDVSRRCSGGGGRRPRRCGAEFFKKALLDIMWHIRMSRLTSL